MTTVGLPPWLRNLRKTPARLVQIRIVDDQPLLAQGMTDALRGWRNLDLETTIYDGLTPPAIPLSTDILLLDDLDEMLYPVHVTGARLASKLVLRGFRGTIVSTALSSSTGPAFGHLAFTRKREVVQGHKAALAEFIKVMNKAIFRRRR